MENKNLPKIQDLYNDIEIREKESQLQTLLNQDVNPKWVKEHPFAKDVYYIPIERIEWLLTQIFIRWRVEILRSQLIGNSVEVTVRLWYIDPVHGDWTFQDGIGAQPLQTEKGAGSIEFNKLNSMAVQQASPAAKSYAVKNAAKSIGKLFGRDLNRADHITFNMPSQFETIEKWQKKVSDAIGEMDESEEKAYFIDMITQKEDNGENTIEFYQNIYNQIKGE
jgi:hypothetical protein